MPTARAAASLLATGRPVEIGSIEKMSKSKKNVVDPDDIIASYGADTARWFMLSDSPPERDVIWTEAGVEGAHRFVQRLWRLVRGTGRRRLPRVAPEASQRRRGRRHLQGGAQDGQGGRRGHRAARLQQGRRPHLRAHQRAAAAARRHRRRQGLGRRSRPRRARRSTCWSCMIAPMMPHLAEECCAALGGTGLVADRPWPAFDPALVVDSEIVMPVQVNGKKRGDLTIARDADQGAVEKAALANSTSCRRRSRGKAAQGDRRAAEDRQCRRLIGRSPKIFRRAAAVVLALRLCRWPSACTVKPLYSNPLRRHAGRRHRRPVVDRDQAGRTALRAAGPQPPDLPVQPRRRPAGGSGLHADAGRHRAFTNRPRWCRSATTTNPPPAR